MFFLLCPEENLFLVRYHYCNQKSLAKLSVHEHLCYKSAATKHVLKTLRCNVLALLQLEDHLGAVYNLDHAVGHKHRDITSQKPPIPKSSISRLRVLIVSFRHYVSSNCKFTLRH